VVGSGSVHSRGHDAYDSNCPHANKSYAVNQAAGMASGSRSGGARNEGKRPAVRTLSCPPGRTHSASAGPWSLEWVNRRRNDFLADVNYSNIQSTQPINSGKHRSTKKKESGYLRHCAQNLKRIARLSDKDRKEVLQALRKTQRRRKGISDNFKKKNKAISNASSSQSGSQASVSNDWTHFVVLKGSEKAKADDVKGFGQKVGLKFTGDKNNMFDVLSGAGRRKNDESVGNEG
jgi:hypothetical protein